jgi:4-alpha-glucanotransferase
LAQAHGILPGYVSEAGDYRSVSDRAKRGVLAAMGVAANSEEEVAASLLSAPLSVSLDVPVASMPCFVPEWLKRSRVWGITCQLYGLRSEQNWGIGDFEDLARLAESAGAHGADFIGVNPLHALFLADPSRRSPYSPSSRRFLNPLYIAVDKSAQTVARTRRPWTPRAQRTLSTTSASAKSSGPCWRLALPNSSVNT